MAASMGWAESPSDFLDRAEELANRALSLDDSEVRARIILAHVHLFHQRYKEAAAQIARAIAIKSERCSRPRPPWHGPDVVGTGG
jgi:adenylate cyclase